MRSKKGSPRRNFLSQTDSDFLLPVPQTCSRLVSLYARYLNYYSYRTAIFPIRAACKGERTHHNASPHGYYLIQTNSRQATFSDHFVFGIRVRSKIAKQLSAEL